MRVRAKFRMVERQVVERQANARVARGHLTCGTRDSAER